MGLRCFHHDCLGLVESPKRHHPQHKPRPAIDSVNHALHHLEEFRDNSISAAPAQAGPRPPRPQQWPPPTLGVVAVSTDAAFSADGRHCGLSGVFRTSVGLVRGSFIAQASAAISPTVAEALAVKHSILNANLLGITHLQIQTDCDTIPKLLGLSKLPITEIGRVLEDIRALALGFSSFAVIYIPRLCNMAAHVFAKFALNFASESLWHNSVPHFLWDTILADMPSNP